MKVHLLKRALMKTMTTSDLLKLRDQAVALEAETATEHDVVEEAKKALKEKQSCKYELTR